MAKLEETKPVFQFGPFRLDPAHRLLLRNDSLVPLTPKVFDTLVALVENAGEVVEKDTLLQIVWPNTFIEESNLAHNISVLRRTLGDGEEGRQYIETVAKRGYRFVMPLQEVQRAVDSEAKKPAEPVIPGKWRLMPVIAAGAGVLIVAMIAFWIRADRRPRPAPEDASVAVLPFVNLSADTENEYFSDGLTDELIHALTEVDGLRVVGRTSSFQFKGKARDLRLVGQQLGVRTVVEGSIRKDGNRLLITAQLINAATGYHLWSGEYERELKDVFAIQSEICHAIVSALRVRLSKPDRLVARGYTENMEVYTLYLQARVEWNKREPANLQRSRSLLEHAIRLDPSYAPAYSGLAQTLIILGSYELLPGTEAFPQAKVAAIKAIEIDPDLGDAHTSLGWVRGWYEWDPSAAEVSFRRGILLNPKSVTAHQWFSEYLSVAGRHEEALREIGLARDLDPISPIVNSIFGTTLFFSGRTEASIEQYRRTLEFNPDFNIAYIFLGHAYREAGRFDDAIRAFDTASRRWGAREESLDVAHTYAVSGRRAKAIQMVNRAMAQPDSDSKSYDLAVVEIALGHRDKALADLERAYHKRTYYLLYANVDHRFDPIRREPTFQALIRGLGLAK